MYGFRRWLLRRFGAQIGEGVRIRPSVEIPYPWKLQIGDYSWIGDHAVLYTFAKITIGHNVVISQKSYLCAGTHDYRSPGFDIQAFPIVIEDEAWLAADVFVAPGVTVGKGAVVGSGSSAVDLAHLLQATGASVRLVARRAALQFNSVPDGAETMLDRLQKPASRIGSGWRSYFCANAPLLFYRLPRNLKDRAITSHMHPAAGWFMREEVEGRIPLLLGRTPVKAEAKDGRALLTLASRAGGEETLAVDHVIAATGYQPDLDRLPFLTPSLNARIARSGRSPLVSDRFETSVPGLYATGLAAMDMFGPLLRFMVGAEFAAPRLAAHLDRAQTMARAA